MVEVNQFKLLSRVFLVLLVFAILFLVLSSYFIFEKTGGNSVLALLDHSGAAGTDQSPQELGWFVYYDNLSDLAFAEDEHGELYLRYSSAGGPDLYKGVGIAGKFNPPPDAEIHLEWRVTGDFQGFELQVEESGGEIFTYEIPSPEEGWHSLSLNLARFGVNSWQEEGADLNGILDDTPLGSVVIVSYPGFSGEIHIRDISFTWRQSPLVFYMVVAIAVLEMLILLLRTRTGLLKQGQAGNLLPVPYVTRFLAVLSSLAYLVYSLSISYRAEDYLFHFGYVLFVSFIVAEDLLSGKVFKARLWEYRLAFIFLLFWFISPRLAPQVFSLFFLIVLIPFIISENRRGILIVLSLASLLSFFHPDIVSRNDIFSQLLALIASGSAGFISYELIVHRSSRADLDRAIQLYEGLLSVSTDGIFLTDEKGTLLSINKGFEKMTGFAHSEIIGRDFSGFFEENSSVGTEEDFDARIRGAEGKILDVHVAQNRVMLDGEFKGYQGIARDVTRRKELERELKEANAHLEALVHIDGLTGVNNRRYFDSALQMEMKRAARAEEPLCLLLIDIDYFKLYNDGYGHQAGDDCLKQIAQVLKNSLKRAGDIVARYGGEEFVVILPSTNRENGEKVAGFLIDAVRSAAIPHEHSKVEKIVTISMGVASCPALENPRMDKPRSEAICASLVALADEALYEAKKNGRNQYRIYKPKEEKEA